MRLPVLIVKVEKEPRMTVNPAWAAISGFLDAVGGSRLALDGDVMSD
jgi:hypothetical protein